MTVKTIRAHLECDGCGKPMSFDLPADYEPPQGWSLFDTAVDAVRGGHPREGGSSSVQGESNNCLCPSCTSTVDNIDPDNDDRVYSDTEIKRALDKELYS